MRRAAHPFVFQTGLVLEESTGLRAATLPVLAELLRTVPDACIYHHTHYFLLRHHYLTAEPANDFAYWVTHAVGEERLGGLLAGIDVMEHASIDGLRTACIRTVDRYLQRYPAARVRFAQEGQEFFFTSSVHVILPTEQLAATLAQFRDALKAVSVRSLYFHMFDARLRLGQPSNDFARWLTEQLGLAELSAKIARLDPYDQSLETLRAMLLRLVDQQLRADA